MQDQTQSVLGLMFLGFMIAIGKLLAGDEVLSVRRCVGRSILGSATSLIAGCVLIHIPDVSPLALYGIGSALGVSGAQAVEAYFRRQTKIPPP